MISIYVTCHTGDEARRIAMALVQARLIACANIIPGVQSVYRWRGSIETETEVVMILKARDADFDEICVAIKRLHSNDVPCITVWPVEQALPAYAEWVEKETDRSAAGE